ncbi:MAG: hypothetical protein F6K21_05535 [Symploca sp. SIO2D2]|nr:hypothetical protein [Symploca sp. SIO2D2]
MLDVARFDDIFSIAEQVTGQDETIVTIIENDPVKLIEKSELGELVNQEDYQILTGLYLSELLLKTRITSLAEVKEITPPIGATQAQLVAASNDMVWKSERFDFDLMVRKSVDGPWVSPGTLPLRHTGGFRSISMSALDILTGSLRLGIGRGAAIGYRMKQAGNGFPVPGEDEIELTGYYVCEYKILSKRDIEVPRESYSPNLFLGHNFAI